MALLLAALLHLTPHARAQICTGPTFTCTTSSTHSVFVTPVGSATGYHYFLNPAVQGVLQRLNALGLPSTLRFDGNAISISTTTTFGPATILIGEDQSIVFFVLPGTTNVNTNTHTLDFFSLLLVANSPALGLLSGDFHTSFQTALLDQNWSFLDALFAQLRGFGISGAGPGAGFNAQFAGLGAADTGGINIAQMGPDGRLRPSPWFVWVRPHGALGKIDSSGERLGFRYDVAGVSAGLEYRWPSPWIAGGTLGYSHTSITQTTTNDKGSIDSLQIGAYGGYRGERTHVVVAALFQQSWISSERLTVLSPAVATASYSAQSYSVGVEAGRKYPVMQAWVQPLASLVFTHLRQGGFTESGTTLLEIAGSARAVNALKLSLGARVWRDFDMGWGTITPEFRARWVQDLLNERRAIHRALRRRRHADGVLGQRRQAHAGRRGDRRRPHLQRRSRLQALLRLRRRVPGQQPQPHHPRAVEAPLVAELPRGSSVRAGKGEILTTARDRGCERWSRGETRARVLLAC